MGDFCGGAVVLISLFLTCCSHTTLARVRIKARVSYLNLTTREKIRNRLTYILKRQGSRHMWIPKDEVEIVDFVTNGKLNESPTFDAKRELSNDSKEVAKDIAAMANDGGVLLYGVGEDQHKRPTLLNPILLKGEPERISNIVRTCISESPDFQIAAFEDSANPAFGYIAVIVPPSPRAPHMVTVRDDSRYYGRAGTSNIRLTEGEVARLYARRQRWEFDIDGYLSMAIERAPLAPTPEAAYLHIVCRPVSSNEELLESIPRQGSIPELLNNFLALVADNSIYPRRFAPDFNYPHNWIRRADGWVAYLHTDPMSTPDRHPTNVLDIQLYDNGGAWLFCGRAADREGESLYNNRGPSGGTQHSATISPRAAIRTL